MGEESEPIGERDIVRQIKHVKNNNNDYNIIYLLYYLIL